MPISAPPSPPPSDRRHAAEQREALLEQALIEEARRRARWRRRRYGAVALIAASAALAALPGLRSGHGGAHPLRAAAKPPPAAGAARPAPAGGAAITLLDDPEQGDGIDWISVVGPRGRSTRIWRCPGNQFCGHLLSAAWAPDGRRLAISLNHYLGSTPYPGVRIIDITTGQDRQIIGASPMADVILYGCAEPTQLAWSPDGSKIAYACELAPTRSVRSEIHIMSADGSDARLLATGTATAAWPAWAPSGTRIAFSTATLPPPAGAEHSQIYSVDLDGGHRRLLATDALAPTWSPDGSLIAYRSACGRVRMMTLDGLDATPGTASSHCAGIGPPGWPVWAPDGRSIAISNQTGVYVIDRRGTTLSRVKPLPGDNPPIPLPVRLAWRPLRAAR